MPEVSAIDYGKAVFGHFGSPGGYSRRQPPLGWQHPCAAAARSPPWVTSPCGVMELLIKLVPFDASILTQLGTTQSEGIAL